MIGDKRGIQVRKTQPVKARRCRRKAGNCREIRYRRYEAGFQRDMWSASCDIKLRWGAAWTIDDIGDYLGTAEHAMMSYVDTRRSQSRRPFIDAPHFELML